MLLDECITLIIINLPIYSLLIVITNIIFKSFLTMSDINSHAYLANLISEGGYELLQATILSQLSAAIGSIASRLLYEFDSGDGNKSNLPGRKSGAKTKPRDRRDMDSYFTSMDEGFFQRKYRMNKISFFWLLDILSDHLPVTGEKRKRGTVPNGSITKCACLSMALRYCAGGDPLDIADLHGI